MPTPNRAVIDEADPTRESLLDRLHDLDDQEGWRVFFDRYWKLIYNSAMKAGLSDAEAQDVVQETVIRVCRKMPEFVYDRSKGSFKNWLLKLTSWKVADQLRRRQKSVERGYSVGGPGGEEDLEAMADPVSASLEVGWDEQWEKTLLDAALENVKRRVDPKQFQVFDLYAVRGWPVSKVAQTLRVSRGKVYLIKHRITGAVKREVSHLRKQPL